MPQRRTTPLQHSPAKPVAETTVFTDTPALMPLAQAIRLVVEDVHASHPGMTTPAAIAHAWNSVDPAGLNWDDEPSATAYSVVLSTDVMHLAVEIGREATLQLSVWDFTGQGDDVTIDGMPALEWLDAMLMD